MQVHIIELIFFYYEYFYVSVNLVSDQWLRGNATMGAAPKEPAWNASRAIDGNVSQNYLSNSCAITDVDKNRNTSIWWKAWLQRQFNVAYLEIYFRSDGEFTKNNSILVGTPHKQIHIFTFARTLPFINLQSSDNTQFRMFTFTNTIPYIIIENSESIQFCMNFFIT